MIKGYKKFSIISKDMLKDMLRLPKPVGMRIFERINYKLHLAKGDILKQAFEEKLFTEEEYNEKYKDMFYDDYGSDSFMQYINAVMNSDVDCFLTINERMLKRKDELKERFGMRIASPEEIADETKNNVK